jgi:VanZ family protein
MILKAFRLPLLWLCVVLFLGSGYFGAQQTWAWILPVLKSFAPWATTAELRGAHSLLRKLGHLTEYGVLAAFWLRAFLVGRQLTVRGASWAALLVCVGCAFVDEAHQSMLLTRTGQPADVILDSLGALAAVIYLRGRLEGDALRPITHPSTP